MKELKDVKECFTEQLHGSTPTARLGTLVLMDPERLQSVFNTAYSVNQWPLNRDSSFD